jgi:phenylpyruvate tautomerase PptA (4-oxalocrotonate tautomerase family)
MTIIIWHIHLTMTTVIVKGEVAMPMIDVIAREGLLKDKPALTRALARAMMKWEQVPDIGMFSDNTAAFVHELPADAFSDANGNADHIRVNVLTPVGILDRDKKLGITAELTDLVVAASGDPSLKDRIWVLIAETPDGGWGLGGHAYTNAEIAAEARRRLSQA